MSDSDLVQAFLAKGGSVKKVAEGEGRGLSSKQWYGAVTREKPLEAPRTGRLHAGATDHLGRTVWLNDEGEICAYE